MICVQLKMADLCQILQECFLCLKIYVLCSSRHTNDCQLIYAQRACVFLWADETVDENCWRSHWGAALVLFGQDRERVGSETCCLDMDESVWGQSISHRDHLIICNVDFMWVLSAVFMLCGWLGKLLGLTVSMRRKMLLQNKEDIKIPFAKTKRIDCKKRSQRESILSGCISPFTSWKFLPCL